MNFKIFGREKKYKFWFVKSEVKNASKYLWDDWRHIVHIVVTRLNFGAESKFRDTIKK